MTQDQDREPLRIVSYMQNSIQPSWTENGKVSLSLRLSRQPTQYEAATDEARRMGLATMSLAVPLDETAVDRLQAWVMTLNERLSIIEVEGRQTERIARRNKAAALEALESLQYDV